MNRDPFFGRLENNKKLFLHNTDGVFTVNLSFRVRVQGNRTEILSEDTTIEAEECYLQELPQEFREAILRADPDIQKDVAIDFFNAVKNSRYNGITTRDAVKACGDRVRFQFCEEVFDLLKRSGDMYRVPGRKKWKLNERWNEYFLEMRR